MPNTTLTFGPPYTGIIRGGDSPGRIEQLDRSTGRFDLTNIQTIAGSTQVIAGFSLIPPQSFGRGARQIWLDADFSIVSMPMLAVAIPGYALAQVLLRVSMAPMRSLTSMVSNRQSIHRFVVYVFNGLGNNFIGENIRISINFKPPERIVADQQFVLQASVESWAGLGGAAQAEASVHEATLEQFVVTCVF